MSKKSLDILVAVILALLIITVTYLITKEQTEQRLVDRICGRADALMMSYQYADRERQIKTDEAASACGIVRIVTNKDYQR